LTRATFQGHEIRSLRASVLALKQLVNMKISSIAKDDLADDEMGLVRMRL
jgi:hypothetical protein